MKKLQNDFTTPKQSKQLLELGVPALSANIVYLSTPDSSHDPYIVNGDNKKFLKNGKGLPCWSVGRLIEIMQVCRTSDVHGYIAFFHDTNNLIDHIISYLEVPRWYDFSKLEEE